jgi:hypothetical protein
MSCWIKNVKVINADGGFAIWDGAQNTIDGVEVIAGYHNCTHMTTTPNNLVTHCTVSEVLPPDLVRQSLQVRTSHFDLMRFYVIGLTTDFL